MKFISKYRGLTNLDRQKELINRFELDPKGKIKKMSKGMKQKLGMIIAFMHDPDILILDEPTSGLDPLYANNKFSGELAVADLLELNLALLFLHLFIAGICFLASCLFSDTKYSIAFGAGIPAFMYVLQMLANTGEKAEKIKAFTFFTLFDANGIVSGDAGAFSGSLILLSGAVLLFLLGIEIFSRKDLCL